MWMYIRGLNLLCATHTLAPLGALSAHILTTDARPFNKWKVEALAPLARLQGHLAHKKHPPSLGPPQGPRHSPTVGS